MILETPLRGEQVVLRALTEADCAGPYPKWLSDPEVCRYRSTGPAPYSVQEAAAFVQRVRASSSELVLAILRKSDNRHLGNISLQQIDPVHRTAEFAILIGEKEAWGRGVGKEASRLLLNYGFCVMNLNRITCGVAQNNQPMRKIAQHLGMNEEGRRRQALRRENQCWDIVDYGILKDQFLKTAQRSPAVKRLLLTERVPEVFEVEPQDRVIALTQQACLELDKRKVAYETAADLGLERSPKPGESEYFEAQLQWLRDLDRALAEAFADLRESNLKPAVLYGYQWKTLMDNVYVRGLELSRLFEAHYTQALLFAEANDAAAPQSFLASYGESAGLTHRLLQLFCAHHAVPFKIIPVVAKDQVNRHPNTGRRNLRRTLKDHLKRYAWILRGVKHSRRLSAGRTTLLFLESNYLKGLLKTALVSGQRCLLLWESKILNLSGGGKTIWQAQPAQAHLALAKQAQTLCDPAHLIWEWPRQWFGFSLAPLFAPMLHSWVTEQIPFFVHQTEALQQFYTQEKVDFALAPFLTAPLHFPAAAACQISPKTQSVLIADGDGPDAAPAWDLTELYRTQHYVVANQGFADYFRSRSAGALLPSAQVHLARDRWEGFVRLSRRPSWNRPPLNLPLEKPIVVYPIAKPEFDVRRLNRIDYSETWHFHLQKALIDLFAKLAQYQFVVKLFPGDTFHGAIGRYTKGLNTEHIHLSQAPFSLWLPWAKRVILDLPTTTLYETALAGVPFHLLLRRDLPIRPEGIKPFLPHTTFFDEPDQAAEAVRAYLGSPRQVTPSPLAPEGPTTLALLKVIQAGSHVGVMPKRVQPELVASGGKHPS